MVSKELVKKVYDALLKEFELWKIEAFVDLLRYEGDKRTNKEALMDYIEGILEDGITEDDIWGAVDNLVPVYTTDIFEWYAKNPYRAYLPDESDCDMYEDFVDIAKCGIANLCYRIIYEILENAQDDE